MIDFVEKTKQGRGGRGGFEKEGPVGKVALEQEENFNFVLTQARGQHTLSLGQSSLISSVSSFLQKQK